MKPNPHTSQQSDLLDTERFSFHRAPSHPLIDYQFRTSQNEGLTDRTASSPSQSQSISTPEFLALNDRYLETAKQDYVVEVISFGVIVAIATWSIISMIYALATTVG